MADGVELITYADRLGGDLPGLLDVLQTRFAGLFTGVHVLPSSVPSTGLTRASTRRTTPRSTRAWDRGTTSPPCHVTITSWSTSSSTTSPSSPQFLDWLAHGSESAYDGMFLTFAGAFPDGAREEDLMRLYRPRPGLPFTPYTLGDGTQAAGLDDVHSAAGRPRRAAPDTGIPTG